MYCVMALSQAVWANVSCCHRLAMLWTSKDNFIARRIL